MRLANILTVVIIFMAIVVKATGYIGWPLLIALIVIAFVFGTVINIVADRRAKPISYKRNMVETEQASIAENKRKKKEIPKYSDPISRYSKLEELLQMKQYADADKETTRVMLHVVGLKDHITEEGMASFPCQDLYSINQLWVNYSNERFGFSVQKRIWDEGGKPRPQDVPPRIDYERFGWDPYQQFGVVVTPSLDFDSMPPGYLPFACLIWTDCYGYGQPGMEMVGVRKSRWWMKELNDRINDGLSAIISRLEACGF
jgi:hypothetical protein